jgi:TPR repeat protein
VGVIVCYTVWLFSIRRPRQQHVQDRGPMILRVATPPSVSTSGVADSEFAKGAEYALGTEGRRDSSTAAVWYLLAAEDGSVSAQSLPNVIEHRGVSLGQLICGQQ